MEWKRHFWVNKKAIEWQWQGNSMTIHGDEAGSLLSRAFDPLTIYFSSPASFGFSEGVILALMTGSFPDVLFVSSAKLSPLKP